MITIKEAHSKKELLEFVKFPFKLFKNNPYWVPSIINDELNSFDKTKNPVFKTAEATYYLAYKNNEIVGRMAVIINWDEVKLLKKNKVRFGWFDVIDDIEVTKALLDKAFETAKKNNLDHIEGPMGFSNLDKVGVLTEGFDQPGNIITWYSMPYYKDHFEKLGFKKEKGYIESVFSMLDVDPKPYIRAAKMVKERYNLKVLNFKSSKDIMPYVDKMFDVFNETYAKLQSFVAVTPQQIEYIKKSNIGFINPEYIKFVVDENNKMVAFTIVMPNFSEALKKANGKLFPFGFYHLLKARKNSKEVVFYLIGILPEYQNKGVTAIIFDEYYKVFSAKKINTCIRTPELDENNAMHNLWKNFNPVINKRRCTYIKDIE